MSGSLKAKIIVVVVLLALTAALVGTCIAYRNRACEHTSLEHIEAVEPTCTESGNIEHWACKRCGATFKDESGAEEIGRVVRTALGHDLTRHSAVEPTCTEAGNVEYWECERCGVIFADSEATKPLDDHIVAASGHDWNQPVWNWSDDYSKATAYFVCNKDSEHVESVTAKVTISSASATCTGSGRITYLAKAVLDGKTYSDSEVVQSGALGHDWTVSEWIWADDHASVTAKFVCSRDPSHTHELTETEIVINEDPATCLADGKTEYSAEIAFDGNTYFDTAVVTLPATGHNWSNPEWTWSGDYSAAEATFTCLNDPLHTETVNAVVTILSSSATCTEPGNTEYKAELSFNENVYTDSQSVSGEALGHDWTVSEWIWSEDYTSVTAKFGCARDPSHTHEVTETEIVINEDPATCEKEGKTEYSVEIAFDGNTYSDTAVVTHPATGHNWSAPKWTWSEDSSEADATFTCLNDPSHTETLAAEVTIVDTTATCTAPGETGFMAKVTFNGKDYTDKQTVTGEALGHAWTVSEWIWSDDYTSVTAKFVCSRDNSHTRAISGQINEDVIKPVSCTEDGESTFTATVSLDGDNYTDQKASVVVKAKGHVLSEKWSADDMYHWHECTVCGEKRDLSTHELVDFKCLVCNHTIIYTEGLEYTLSDDGASYLVSGIGEATDRDIKIMPRYEGKPVTGIADNAFKSNTEIDSVLIPDGVESIGAYAFYDCGYLTKVVIPDSVKSIGSSAFYYCSRITRVDYSGDITGWLNIEGLNNLMYFVSSSCELYIGGTKVEGDIFIPEELTSIPGSAFIYQKGITSVTIPDSVTSIGWYAFCGCSGITKIDYLGDIKGWLNIDGLVNLMDHVSSSCELYFGGKKVEGNIIIPKGVTSIPSSAFRYQTDITSVTIPDSVTSIGTSAFYNCSGITRIDYSGDISGWLNIEGLEYLMRYVSSSCELYFGDTKVEELVIPDEVTSIPDYAFQNLTDITSVTIPDSVTSIGEYAFEGCINLIQKVDGVGYVDKWVVDCDSSVTAANIRNDTVGIADSAFSGCKTLQSVTIPDSVKIIGGFAFSDCSSLTEVTIGTGVTSIGDWAFYDCTALSTLNWNAVNVSGFDSSSNVFTGAGTRGNGISVTFGDSVESIPDYLFYRTHSNYNYPNIVGIKIGNNVKSIGSHAFRSVSSVSSVIIPASVESIGAYAFYDIDTIYCEVQSKPTKWSSNWADSSINVKWGDNNNKTDSSEFDYVVRDNKAYLTKYKGSGTEVTIPDTLNGYKVVSFGEIFKNNTNITEVVIGNNVTSVFPYAFYGCSSLTSVTIPDSVTSIGQYAFRGCSLTEVTIPDSVTSIGSYAFRNCSGLESVTIGDGVTSIENYAFENCSGLQSVTIGNGVTSIGQYAFYGCSGLTEVTIPDSVKSIGQYAFYGCSGLTSVTIGNGVTSIGERAFSGCSSLTEVTIPDSVTSIAMRVFYGCSGLKTVTIGNGVTSIGERAFYGCSSLTSVTIPDSVTSIGNYAFYDCSSLTSVTIPDSVTSIGNYAFEDCSSLTSIIIPDSVTSIGTYAFSGCSRLTSVTIGNGVTSIGSSAFSGCRSLTSVTIPDSVTSIGQYTFYNCSGLQSVTIGNGVTSIENYAFGNCSGLQSVTIGNGVKSIGIDAFYNNFSSYGSITKVDYSGGITGWLNIKGLDNLMKDVSSSCELYFGGTKVEELVIPDGVTSIPRYAFINLTGITSVTIPDSVTSIGASAFYNCSGITRIDYSGDITGWLNIEGLDYLMSYVSSGCELYIDDTKVEELVILDGVTSIPSYAFQNLTDITSVKIPDSVTSIENYAFSGCSGLQSVTIGNGVTSIGDNAFSGCSGLQSVTIGNGVTSIGDDAFSGCSALTSVIIPDSVTSIGSYAFSGCSSLISVTIPDSVTSIGSYAFSGCSSLTSVTISDSVTSIGSSAFSGCSGLTSVTMGNGVTSIKNYAFENCSGLQSVTIGNGVTSIGSYAFRNCSSLTSIIIPDSVKSIGSSAFENCSSLTSVTIPDSVTSIGSYAFEGCSRLTSVKIPDSVTSIGDRAFSGCSGLKSVTIGNGVTSIGNYAFYDCSSLTSVTIPDSVTSIGTYAFSGCSRLTSVTIGTGVKSIGRYAFNNCSRLTSARFINTSGWVTSTSLDSVELEDRYTAAQYLRSTYVTYTWSRS